MQSATQLKEQAADLAQAALEVERSVLLAVELAVRYGGVDGAHHKAWVIDQMVRALSGTKYREVIAYACAGEDGPDTYEWDEGVAP